MKTENTCRFLHGKLVARNPEFRRFVLPEEEASCFFVLGQAYARYSYSRPRTALIMELCKVFSEYNVFPENLHVHIDGNYSHRLIRQVFRDLGYELPDDIDDFNNFVILKVVI